MSTYKVIVRNSPNWREHHTATLGVSVLSPNWQDNKFESILEFCAAHFRSVRIELTDSLYRHNFMAAGFTPMESRERALQAGTDWLQVHQPAIEDCPIPTKIVRWGDWYKHPEFKDTLNAFEKSHYENPVLRDAVDRDAMEYYRRRNLKPTLMKLEHARNFLLEELAVSTLQARQGRSVKVYPGDDLQCLNLVRQGLIPEVPTGLEQEQFAKIKFHTRRSHEQEMAKLPIPDRNAWGSPAPVPGRKLSRT